MRKPSWVIIACPDAARLAAVRARIQIGGRISDLADRLIIEPSRTDTVAEWQNRMNVLKNFIDTFDDPQTRENNIMMWEVS